MSLCRTSFGFRDSPVICQFFFPLFKMIYLIKMTFNWASFKNTNRAETHRVPDLEHWEDLFLWWHYFPLTFAIQDISLLHLTLRPDESHIHSYRPPSDPLSPPHSHCPLLVQSFSEGRHFGSELNLIMVFIFLFSRGWYAALLRLKKDQIIFKQLIWR